MKNICRKQTAAVLDCREREDWEMAIEFSVWKIFTDSSEQWSEYLNRTLSAEALNLFNQSRQCPEQVESSRQQLQQTNCNSVSFFCILCFSDLTNRYGCFPTTLKIRNHNMSCLQSVPASRSPPLESGQCL